MQAVNIKWISDEDMVEANDWRADYHLSTAALLPVLAKQRGWMTLVDRNVSLVDGWRFSESPESEWYMANISLLDTSRRDPVTLNYLPKKVDDEAKRLAKAFEATVLGELFYRMRHISDMRLNPEAAQYSSPIISLESCIKPSDVVIRRVGSALAAYVSEFDRQHPIDANMAIIRGLNRYDALWLTYCLQQPVYVDYLEQRIVSTDMVRVGLSKIKNMPLGPKPQEFNELTDQYIACLETLYFSQMHLHELREQVSKWLDEYLKNNSIEWNKKQLKTAWFNAEALTERLDFGFSEQSKVSRQLIAIGGQYLTDLAVIDPQDNQILPERYQLVKIRDLKPNLTLSENLATIDENVKKTEKLNNKIKKVKKRLIQKNDVLISTFARESKVLWINQKLDQNTLVSEHLSTLFFHQHAGAYTLLLETPLMKWQLNQLVTGNVQSFINLSDLANITFPQLPNEKAADWHHELDNMLSKQNQSLADIKQIQQKMKQVYHSVHPTIIEVNHAD
ncbi:hypothetical protein [Pseudoalteromonas sp. SG43-3]|uniref:hypothetical protein n=1 Tax=Pseudoalteromonas sp. SG43-3 TaxID=2760970 RepID=UPI0016013F43|nr:hypothetical protein [Pseudoalteromonas sp. SG43-3]MBB1445285.1 hypothetical protein [Pseudoalteromonas sp. SG43-3]